MPSIVDFAYYGALHLAWPYLLYKVAPARGRRQLSGLAERMGRCAPRQGDRPCIWIHGVSVGEIRAAGPLIAALDQHLPGYDVALSTTTGTGQEVARRSYADRHVFYYPLDLSFAVRRCFDAIRPDLVVLVELEIWPNFLGEAWRRRVPVALVNGRISEKSFNGYRLVRRWLFDPIGKIGRFCVQTETYPQRFRRLGIPDRQIHITGSMKYDQIRVAADADGAAVRRDIGVGPDDLVVIGGSTHPGGERARLLAYERLRARPPNLRLVLVPRHTERTDEVRRQVTELGQAVVRRTERLQAGATAPLAPGEVLLVDTIGELGRLYAAADVVFVGGSLIPHGGQNMLEPAALGKPTVFGPSYENFIEPVERLLAARGARLVPGEPELERALGELLDHPDDARAMGERGREAMLAARGATARTVAVIQDLLERRRRDGRRLRPGP
jgi:3-deoxy-D-manno-octulosonic-acid transferase